MTPDAFRDKITATDDSPFYRSTTGRRDDDEPIAVYDGLTAELTRIAAVNALLALLTLGIYRFWGRTRIHRYFRNHIAVQGEHLEYCGSAGKAALRFSVGSSVFVILASLLWESMDGIYHRPLQFMALKTALIIGIPFVTFFALFHARGYRLSQTRWRDLQFTQRGNAWIYALQATALLLLVVLTGGLAYPHMQSRLQSYRINNTWLGDRQFSFDGVALDLFRQWVPALLLAIPTLGCSILWYKVTEFRYVASRTRLGKLGFSSRLPAKDTVLLLVKFVVYAIVLSIVSALVVLGSAGVIFALVNAGGEIPQPPHSMKVQVQIFMGVVVFCLLLAALLKLLYTVVLLHPMIRSVTTTLTTTGTNDLDSIKPGGTAKVEETTHPPTDVGVWANA